MSDELKLLDNLPTPTEIDEKFGMPLERSNKKRGGGANIKEMTGLRFGKLVVIGRSKNTKNGTATWLCRCCDCGKEKTVRGDQLRNGFINSCRCARKKKTP